ncbi:hypothetical protein H0H87_004725, partial [Tephrocybe sp. NHM501043]
VVEDAEEYQQKYVEAEKRCRELQGENDALKGLCCDTWHRPQSTREASVETFEGEEPEMRDLWDDEDNNGDVEMDQGHGPFTARGSISQSLSGPSATPMYP